MKAVNLQNGELLWSVGRRGGGPGEFSNPTDVRLSADGRLWVLDPPNLRISMFSTDGEFLGSMRVEESLFRLGSIAGSRFRAIRSDPMDGLLVELDSTGRLHREVPSPAWTSDVPAMAAGVWIATDATDGAMAVVFPYSGRTLFAKASDAPFRDVVDVVESRPEPEQLTYSPRPGMTVRRLTPKASMLVVSAAISSDEIWILINGTGEGATALWIGLRVQLASMSGPGGCHCT